MSSIEQVVGDGELAEQVALPERPLLAVAGEQGEELRLERPPRTASGVRVGEERVVRVVQDDRRVEPRAEAIGERRLAHAGRAVDGEMAELQDGAQYIGAASPQGGQPPRRLRDAAERAC